MSDLTVKYLKVSWFHSTMNQILADIPSLSIDNLLLSEENVDFLKGVIYNVKTRLIVSKYFGCIWTGNSGKAMLWISVHNSPSEMCRIKIHCILKSVNYITWNDKFRLSLFQTWKLYENRTTIRHFLIRSDVVTFYLVLEVSQIL